jgi:hypothetical protein
LGYDLLFQDVDVVWYRNPLDYFESALQENIHNSFDIYFQDDGSHSSRYAPYAANSGFYFMRNNIRTKYFVHSLLMSGDIILKTASHQQAMTAVLVNQASLYGLRIKVMSRDDSQFPSGFHYQRRKEYMQALVKGEADPYIFHMCWTVSKENKILFLRQMGEWYLEDTCAARKLDEITIKNGDFVQSCCSAEPIFSCHFRDRPSIKPCKESPPLEKGQPSFW